MTTHILAWGTRSPSVAFALRVIQMGRDFDLDPNWPMTCMEFESGLDPKAKNPHSSATGLIQFMEVTAAHYGTTTSALARMTAEKQFDYVWLYFRDAIRAHGPILNVGDCYLAILDPEAMGKPDDYVMWVSGSSAYAVNAGLDVNKDHQITRGEVVARIEALLAWGLVSPNVALVDDILSSPFVGVISPAQPQGHPIMNLISSALSFVWDHTFASAARAAATADPASAATGIDIIKNMTAPTDGPANSPAGIASGPIGDLENAINDLVANFIKGAVDQLPAVGGIAEVTGLDQKAADAAKALLVLAEQHALTFMSNAFSRGHAAVNAVTVPSSNGAAVGQGVSASPPSAEEAPH
jgi:hypothetical protein